MNKSEGRMTKSERNPNDESRMANSQSTWVRTASIANTKHRDPRGGFLADVRISEFVILSEFVIRPSSFVIQVSCKPLTIFEPEMFPAPVPLAPFAAISGCDRCGRRREPGVFLCCKSSPPGSYR